MEIGIFCEKSYYFIREKKNKLPIQYICPRNELDQDNSFVRRFGKIVNALIDGLKKNL